MLIGELPRGYDPTKYDDVIFSKDGVHLLRIPYEEFVKGVGGGGRGLKYWIETETEFKRDLDYSSEFIDNDLFDVPGNAEITVKVDLIPITPIEQIDKYYDGREVITYGDTCYLYNGRYYLKRSSSKTIIGGALMYKSWGNLNDSRILTNDDVYYNSNLTFKRWNVVLPGWVLMSTHSKDVEYDLIHEAADGTTEVLEHVYEMSNTIEWNGLTLYVNGCPKPSIYEPLFIKPRTAESGPQYEFAFHGTGSYWWFERPESSVKAGEWIPATQPTNFDKLPVVSTSISDKEDRRTWVIGNLSDTFINSGQRVTENYGKMKDEYVFTTTFGANPYNYKTSYVIKDWGPNGQLLSYKYEYVEYNYDNWVYLPPLDDEVDYSSVSEPKRTEFKQHCIRIGYTFTDPDNLWHGVRTDPGFQRYEKMKTSPDLKWFGNVTNYGGIEYGSVENPSEYKDAVHYMFYDAGITKLGHYTLGLSVDPGDSKAIYSAANVSTSGETPSEENMQFMILKKGIFRGTDFQIKVDGEWQSIKELSPDPEDLTVTRLKNYTYDPSTEQTTRMTNLNIWTNNNLVHFVGKAASSGVTGGPPADAHVIHIPWDNNSDALGVQLAIAHGSNPRLYIRAQGASSDSWSNWFMVPRLGGKSMVADKVLCSGPNSTILLTNVSSTEVEYLSGVTSNLQQQLNEKAAVSVTEYTQTGEHIADIIVNGTTHPIYAPTGGGGGGGSSYHILTGAAAPLDTQGENGDLYLQKASGIVWRYIKFEITKHKTPNNYTQLTELQFLDSNNKVFNFQGSNAWSNQPHYTATDGPTSMIDGVIRNDSKALWVCAPTAANPITAIIESRVPLDLSVYSKIRMITGGDAEARDPSTWTISVSNDQQNWILINSESDYVMTSTRLAVGYEGTAILPDTMQPMVIQRYYKDSGHWMPIYN